MSFFLFDWLFSLLRNRRQSNPPVVTEDLKFEAAFIEEVSQWDNPSLVATSHAVEVEQLLNQKTDFHKDSLFNFVNEHGLRSGLKRKLQDFRAKIVVIKAMIDLPCDTPLSTKIKEVEEEGWFSEKDRREMTDQVRTDLSAITKNRSHEGDLVDLHVCLLILRQLGEPVQDFREPIYNYIVACYRKAYQPSYNRESSLASFALAPNSPDICLTACIFAARLAATLEIGKELNSYFEKIESFVLACWSKEECAFSTLPKARPNLIHTHAILNLDPARKVNEHKWYVP
ncbi:MAG: hypothetical protein FJ147_00330 [Deltaproteobacteria bacterium]|nr:hypothetical protein [Deltaproteobacteria bacterium]